MSTRAPAFRIAGSSFAWSMPSTVQSTTSTAPPSAAITGSSPWMASVAPVERIGTGLVCFGVGTTTWNGARAEAERGQLGESAR